MAGIGFEIRKLMVPEKLFGTVRAYTYAGLISSGPWIFSILGILVLGLITQDRLHEDFQITQFQTSLTNLIAGSLIFSGFLQLAFTRYVADQSFLKHENYIMPSFNGALLLMAASSGIFAMGVILFTFQGLSLLYCFLMEGTFILLCCIWMSVTMLMGLKRYKSILFSFIIAYGTAVALGYSLTYMGLNGLLIGFFVGHVFLFAVVLAIIYEGYPSDHVISFDFLVPGKIYISLIFSGVMFNLAIWIDKYIFWFHPYTGSSVIGPFHSSNIYDLPIFIAYLSLIPGMAIFLLRVETDFMSYYSKFYNAIVRGGTLFQINEAHSHLVTAGQKAIIDVAKIQGASVLIILVSAKPILTALGISSIHLNLLYIDSVGVALQLIFMSIVNLFFYLDRRYIALFLTSLFFVLNTIFSIMSIHYGPNFYGYGFTGALIISVIVSILFLNNAFDKLEYKTFMLQ